VVVNIALAKAKPEKAKKESIHSGAEYEQGGDVWYALSLKFRETKGLNIRRARSRYRWRVYSSLWAG
jgi:hypothetical protein